MTTDPVDVYGESRDGSWGAGDHDTPYLFGRASAGLTIRVLARLLILRGLIRDRSHESPELRYGGDSAADTAA